MRSPVADLLADLGRALESLEVRWYLFGAQAAILYGAARLTADVDVTIDAGSHPTSDVVSTLRSSGFALRVQDIDGFVRRTRVLPLLHEPSRMPCDLVLAGPGIEELFFERARTHDLEGVAVPVAAADDVVAMKILAGRVRDLDDVAAILGTQGRTLDIERVRRTLASLEAALDRRDLLPVLEQIIDRQRRKR
jgi:hypothetical protein